MAKGMTEIKCADCSATHSTVQEIDEAFIDLVKFHYGMHLLERVARQVSSLKMSGENSDFFEEVKDVVLTIIKEAK